MPLDESQFHRDADALLARLADEIDEECGDEAEVTSQGGVVTIVWEAGGTHVINKHAPTRQIWLSSPTSGASHFEFGDQGWVSTRAPHRLLLDVLGDELSARMGKTITVG